MSGSVSFDRAADYYDRTRSLPTQLIPLLLDRLPRKGLCIEIGVGTGRIALPLAEAGLRVVGVDLSAEMLKKLVSKRRGSWPEVSVADATCLPFADQTFAAAVAAHVLHLIPDWRSAVGELLRVLRADGILVAARGGRSRPQWHRDVMRRFFKHAGDPPWPPGLDSIEELDHHMHGLGVAVHPLPDLITQDSISVNQLLDTMEAGYWSACWSIDPENRRRAAVAAREWARKELGDLDLQRHTAEATRWHAYQLGEEG